MRYCAECDCTDFDERFYARGDVVTLDPAANHSVYLVPVEEGALEAEAAVPEVKATPVYPRTRKKSSQAEA